jgi:hypothetical protein
MEDGEQNALDSSAMAVVILSLLSTLVEHLVDAASETLLSVLPPSGAPDYAGQPYDHDMIDWQAATWPGSSRPGRQQAGALPAAAA